MIIDSFTEQPNFLSMDGYTFYYTKQILLDFNKEQYTINTGLSDALMENNPELYNVLEYFADLIPNLDCDEDIKNKCLDTLYMFLNQICDEDE